MAFAEERRNHRHDQQQQEPRGKPEDARRKAGGDDELLNQRADGLDHRDAIGSLHAGALQLVVKNRVFVRSQIQSRGVLYHFDADVAGEAVRQKRVEKAGGAAQNGARGGKQKFGCHKPPEIIR